MNSIEGYNYYERERAKESERQLDKTKQNQKKPNGFQNQKIMTS